MNNYGLKSPVKKPKSSFTTGGFKYGNQPTNSALGTSKQSPQQLKAQALQMLKYPKGYVPATFITLCALVAFLVAFFYSQLFWIDAVTIALGLGFLFSLWWLVLRQNFNPKNKYNRLKFYQQFTLKNFRIKRNWINHKHPLNHVTNITEFEIYLGLQKTASKLVFCITLFFYTFAFLIFIIINLTVARG